MEYYRSRTTPRTVRPSLIKPVDAPLTARPNDFELNVQYTNGLPFNVVITLRNGMSISLPGNRGRVVDTKDLVVRTSYRFDFNVNIDSYGLLDDTQQLKSSAELKALNEATRTKRARVFQTVDTFAVDYHIFREELEKNGGSVYIKELDIVVSVYNPDAVPIHPYSDAGEMINKRKVLARHTDGTGFMYVVEIVDNSSTYGDRFMRINNKTYRVRAIVDPSRPNGVYLYHTPGTEDSPLGETCVAEHFEFEAADSNLPLFTSESEANSHGDELTERERKFKISEAEWKANRLERERELKLAEIELQEYKSNMSKEEMDRSRALKEREQEAAELERELDRKKRLMEEERIMDEHRRKMESLAMKDQYEARSHRRKDTSESLSWVPKVIVGIGAAVVAAKTMGMVSF